MPSTDSRLTKPPTPTDNVPPLIEHSVTPIATTSAVEAVTETAPPLPTAAHAQHSQQRDTAAARQRRAVCAAHRHSALIVTDVAVSSDSMPADTIDTP